jgi:glyoxylase-like metal-dependent hydrolase (beta-lactamase superfamily II)
MPDKTGAFMLASRIISKHGGNIVRVSYNKAVDLHTLFIDVEAAEEDLEKIAGELSLVGYLDGRIPETRVIVVEIRIPDVRGAMLPVLKILDRYDINISYMNSSSNGTPYQNFRMGLLIENPQIIKMLLDDISEIYQIGIVDYDDSEANLDNTIFYIRLAGDMQKLLGLAPEQTMEFISESNRVLQNLQESGGSPEKVFNYIRQLANFVHSHQGANFKPGIQTLKIGSATLTSIQPPCGSNTYILDAGGELALIDTGFAAYAAEMFAILRRLFPDWDERAKKIYLTHADVDHCGLLSKLDEARIYLNRKSADGLRRQSQGMPDYRESVDLGFGYSKLSRIISGYTPPDASRFELLDGDTPEEHEDLLKIGAFTAAGLAFDVYEGSGGHLWGEEIFVCREHGLIFTGDILLNIGAFSPEQAEFTAIAPYLMRSVNVDSKKAAEMRKQVIALAQEIERENGKPCVILGGHGPISKLIDGKLI